MASFALSEIRILYILLKSRKLLTIKEISEATGLSQSHVSRIMRKLEKMDLVSYVTASIVSSVAGLFSKMGKKVPNTELSSKTKLYYPNITMDELLQRYPELKRFIEFWEKSEKS